MERRLLDAGVAPLPDLIVWWAAHDGAPGEVADSWRLLGLDEALGLREEYRRNYSDAGAPDRWPTGWVPVLAFAGAAVLCADGETGAVHVEDDGFPEPSPPQFDSLADLVGTLLRAQGLGASAAAHDPELRRLWWW